MNFDEPESVEPTRYPAQFKWICPWTKCRYEIISYSESGLQARKDLHWHGHRMDGSLIKNPNILSLTVKDVVFLKDVCILVEAIDVCT